MTTYLVVGVASGLLFALLDGLINANPLGRRINEPYRPIARTSINLVAGTVIDILYGLAMAGLFLLVRPALPGGAGALPGVAFGFIAWFFRGLMNVLSQWIMFTIPIATLVYTMLTGLVEMMVLGLFYGMAFRSFP